MNEFILDLYKELLHCDNPDNTPRNTVGTVATTAYPTPFHPPFPEQQQQTEYNEMVIDSFGDMGVSFGQ
jgi:hypothetical protein